MSIHTGDALNQLPVDDTHPSHDEIMMVNELFKKEKNTITKILDEVKSVILVAVLFIVFSLPVIDTTLHRFIPMTQNSWIILTLIKAVAFMIIFYLISNISFFHKSIN